jgi:hypothetical protein
MTELVTLIAPPVDFSGSEASSLAAKRVILLENLLPPEFGPLTGPVKIRGLLIWNQMAGDYPAGCSGDVSVAVDPGKRFITASGFPAVETCDPMFLKCLGVLEFAPGREHGARWTFDPPIVYHPGVDAIVFAPEANTTGASPPQIAIFQEYYIEAAGDFALAPGVVFNQALDTNSNNNSPPCCLRSLIPNIAVGGSQVAVRVTAGDQPLVLSHVGVGIQSGSGPNMTAAPAAALFNGQPGVTVPAGQSMWGYASLVTQAGQSLVLNFSRPASWKQRSVGSAPSWFAQDADSYGNAAMQGTVIAQANRTHCVDCVMVQ